MTWNEAAARDRAIPKPIPWAAPVTRATLGSDGSDIRSTYLMQPRGDSTRCAWASQSGTLIEPVSGSNKVMMKFVRRSVNRSTAAQCCWIAIEGWALE
jgi:hypothetical protein